ALFKLLAERVPLPMPAFHVAELDLLRGAIALENVGASIADLSDYPLCLNRPVGLTGKHIQHSDFLRESALSKQVLSIMLYDNQARKLFMSYGDAGEKFALGSEEAQRFWQEYYRGLVGGFDRQSDCRYIGRSIPRNDVLYKVRGQAKYVANL